MTVMAGTMSGNIEAGNTAEPLPTIACIANALSASADTLPVRRRGLAPIMSVIGRLGNPAGYCLR